MSIFEYTPEELLGTVESVDTSTVIVKVENDDKLRGLQVNHLVSIQSSKIGQHLIGLVSKIIRKSAYSDPVADLSPELGFNIIKVILIGTHFDRDAGKDNVFRRSLATIPTINAECHLIHGDRLKRFMQAISSIPEGEDAVSLQIGNYSIDEDATAWLNGNKLFHRSFEETVKITNKLSINNVEKLKFCLDYSRKYAIIMLLQVDNHL